MRIIKVKLKSLFQIKIILFLLFISVINYISFSQNTLVFDTLGISLNIKPYDTISITYDIIINNNNNWGIFEGEGGIVYLYDENKNLLCQQFLNPKGEWYLNPNDSIKLYATLQFTTFSKKRYY